MKRIHTIATLFICLLSLIRAQGQGSPCTDSVGISTDPRPGKAYNNDKVNDTTFQIVNTFNWMNASLTPSKMYGSYLGQPPLASPFFANNYDDLYYLAHGTDSDFYPEDGWELIQWGFGKLVDGTDEIGVLGYARQLPCLILYNRHSGMLHVFGASDFTESKVVQVELMFTPGSGIGSRSGYTLAGMLGYASALAQPLDQPTTISHLRSRAPNPNQTLRMFHAAFPIAYDPCVCNNKSAFKVIFRRIHSMSVNLYGRLAATSYSPAEYLSGALDPDFEEFLNSVYVNGTSVVAGVQVHKDASKMYDDLITEMNAAGKLDIKAALDVLKALMELGTEYISTLDPGVGVVKKLASPLKVGAKSISFLQSIVKLKDALDPPKPSLSLPAIIRGEITMSGEIEDTLAAVNVTEFAVPGSKDSWTLPESEYTSKPYYPLYNEELGVFALLETPKVKRYISHSQAVNTGSCLDYGQPYPPQEMRRTEYLSYRLDPIKYAVNPAARLDMDNSDISVAIELRRPMEGTLTGSGYAFSLDVSRGNLEEGVEDHSYFSPFIPIECLESLTLYLTRQQIACGTGFFNSADTLYLHFANTYLSSTLGSDGLPVASQQILTFPVIIEDVSSPLPSSPQIPFEVSVSGALTGDVRAWNQINITGNISSSSPVQLIAGNEIVIDPTVTLTPNLELITGTSPIACGSANLPQTPLQLNAFCTSSQYKANQLSRLGQQYLANAQARDSRARIPQAPAFSLTAFPNPFDETLTLRYELPEAAQVSLVLLDLMGRPVIQVQAAQAMPAGPQEITFDASQLASGLYHAVLQTGDRREAVKVVKE